MKIIKLPRIEKKRLKKGFWLYPKDKNNCRRMAFPHRYEEDYFAMKQGILTNLKDKTEDEIEQRRKEREELDREIYVDDRELLEYVEDVFHKDYVFSSYNILREAKEHKKAKIGYFNFINAYHKSKEVDSFTNVCCMAVDFAKDLMKSTKLKRKKRKRYNS